MRYEYIVQSPCPQCQAPLIRLACFCCSEVAHRDCLKCGLKDTIPNKVVWDELMYLPHATNTLGLHISKHRPLTADEVAARDAYQAKWKAEHPGEERLMGFLRDEYRIERLGPEEAEAFKKQMQECGYLTVAAPQIGFLGDQQCFDKPWKMGPDVKVA